MFRPGMDMRKLLDGSGEERVRPEKNEWPFVIAGILFFFITLFLYIIKFNVFSQTMNGGKLFLYSAILALLVGFILGRFFSKDADEYEKWRVFATVIFLCMLSFPLYAHLLNKGLASSSIQHQDVEIIKNDSYIHSQMSIPLSKINGGGYYLHFEFNNKATYLRTDEPIYADKGQGSIISLPFKKGGLGFSILDLKQIQNAN